MKSNSFIFFNQFICLVVLIFATSCFPRYRIMNQDMLFSLDIGKMENEFYLSVLPQETRVVRDNYVNQNGLFYISNSHINKVMVVSPFGDLITLFYDPKINPSPVLLNNQHDQDVVFNLNAYPHDFINIGLICSNKKNHIFIEDELFPNSPQKDATSGISFNRVIKWFDNNGEYLNYIGQEGLGGTPFSHISALFMGNKDRLSVVCKEQNLWKIFIYDSSGKLIHSIVFDDKISPWNTGDDIVFSEDVLVDYACSKILVKVNSYERNYIGSDEHIGSINFKETAIWVYNINEAQFVSQFSLPRKFIQIEGYTPHVVLYDLIGFDKYTNLYFIAPYQDELYDLLVVNVQGKTIGKTRLKIDKRNLYFNQFYVSEDGIISSLLGYDEKVYFHQWRLASFFKRIRK